MARNYTIKNLIGKFNHKNKKPSDFNVFCNIKREGNDILFEFDKKIRNSSLELKIRSTDESLKYEINGLKAYVPLSDFLNYKKNVFDVYLNFDSTRKRVKSKEENESFSVIFDDDIKALVAYSTQKNNLSFKFRNIFSYTYSAESFDLNEGILSVNGPLDLKKNVEAGPDPKFFLKLINRQNAKETYFDMDSGIVKIPLDAMLEDIGYGVYDIFVISKLGNAEYFRRLKSPFEGAEENLFLTENDYPLYLYSTLNGNLSFRFDFNYIVTEFDFDGNCLIFEGEFFNDSGSFDYGFNNSSFMPEFIFEIKNRASAQRVERKIEPGSIKVPASELFDIKSGNIFDFYFKIRTDSGIKRKRIKFSPKIERLKFPLKDYKTSLALYSTVTESLSLRLTEKDFDMDISQLENIGNNVFIKGTFTPLNVDIGNINKVSVIAKYRYGFETNEFVMDLKGNEFEGFIGDLDFADINLLNSRIDFFLRLYDEDVFFQELIILSNLKNFYYDDERFIIKVNHDNIIYSYYATQNTLSFALWVTTEEFYNNSFSIAKGRHVYNEVCDNRPLNDKLIFFESFGGEYYGGNPKYIYEYMLKNGFDEKYTFVWSYRGNEEIPGNPIIVDRKESLDYYKYLAEAKYWINNNTFPIFRKRKGNIYLQTWHGTPLKKLGWDVEIPGPEMKGREEFYKESRNWDYLISSNNYSTDRFSSAFKFNEETLELGYPINDIFFNENEETIRYLKDKFNIPEDKKVILYAPTWKDDERSKDNVRYFNLDIDLERLYYGLKDEYVIILKTHYFVSKNLRIDEKLKDFVIDLSFYDDICHLCLISDILITDYSSVFFDYAHSRRPILFFVPDLEHYVSEVRGLYLNMETDVPGPIIKDNDHLIECIENIDVVMDKYSERYDEFYDKFCSLCKGHSSEDIIKRVFEIE